jgi:hypothetical protein
MATIANVGGVRISEKDAARALGWASLGIALAEIVTTGLVQRMMGIRRHGLLLRGLGARELASGVAILQSDDPTPAVWSRVAGDAMDLALLAAAARKTRRPAGLGLVTAMVLGVTALDVWVAWKLSQSED